MDRLPENKLPALRVMTMPADANQNGDIFGGWIMSHVDIAGGILATRPRALRPASMPPARSPRDLIQPPEMEPCRCASAGTATARRAASVAAGPRDSAPVLP